MPAGDVSLTLRPGSREYLTRVEGDFGETYTLTLQEENGSATDLTNATVSLHGRLEGETAARLDVTMTIVNLPGTDGIVSYVFLSTDAIAIIPGLWILHVEASYAARQATRYTIIVSVQPQQA